jgi:predicted nuclease with RNAse H fold
MPMYNDNKNYLYMGIDVQISKGCSYFIVDEKSEIVNSGWTQEGTFLKTAHQLKSVALETAGGRFNNIAIGIDSPRMALKEKRQFNWDGKKHTWRKRLHKEKGHGRHCEVVTKSLGIANPQWTRLEPECEDWMLLGFEIYRQMKDFNNVFEVFPSAAYNMLKDDQDVKVTINFSNFFKGPKDMLDACVAAMTVYEFMHDRGTEVGGGDGLGTIILPRPLIGIPSRELLSWPDKEKV